MKNENSKKLEPMDIDKPYNQNQRVLYIYIAKIGTFHPIFSIQLKSR